MTPEKPVNSEKTQHSGNAPEEIRELPVTEFGSTSLEAAAAPIGPLTDQFGNLMIPDSPSVLVGNLPMSTPEKKGFSKRNKLIAIIAGGALALGIGGGVAAGVSAANNGSQPVATAPADPTEKPTPAETKTPTNPEDLIVVDKLPENVVEHGMFAALTPEQQTQIKTWESMSVDEFRSQPQTDQEVFAWFVFENNKPILDYRLDQQGISAEYTYNATTPEEIEANSEYKIVLLSSLKSMTTDTGIVFQSDLARKLTVLITDNDTDLGKQRTVDLDEGVATMNLNTPPTIRDFDIQGYAQDTNGWWVISMKNLETGTETQQTFSIETFTSIEGKTVSFEQQELAVLASDPRYIPDLTK